MMVMSEIEEMEGVEDQMIGLANHHLIITIDRVIHPDDSHRESDLVQETEDVMN